MIQVLTIIESLVRHKGKVLLWLVLAMVGAMAWILFCPPKYLSESKLLVRAGRENSTLDPTATLGREQLLAVPSTRESDINSAIEVLNSRALAEKLVDALGSGAILETAVEQAAPADSATRASHESKQEQANLRSRSTDMRRALPSMAERMQRDRAVHRLLGTLEVTAVHNSNVIRLSYEAASPEAAQAVLAKTIAIFLEEYVRLNRPAGASQFFEDQEARLRGALGQAEESLRR